MCGRFTLTISIEAVLERFNVVAEVPALAGLVPRFNVAPGQDMPAVTDEAGGRTLRAMSWGLTPPWAAAAPPESRRRELINVRAESLRDKPGFRQLFRQGRCLVPADGFYEWQHLSGRTRGAPFRFVLRTREPFAFAGLWTDTPDPDGRLRRTFAIVTTDANDTVRPVHDRMPVILPRTAETQWLDPATDSAALLDLLRPLPAADMTAYAVSPEVNSPRCDAPACVEPWTAPPSAPQLLLPLA